MDTAYYSHRSLLAFFCKFIPSQWSDHHIFIIKLVNILNTILLAHRWQMLKHKNNEISVFFRCLLIEILFEWKNKVEWNVERVEDTDETAQLHTLLNRSYRGNRKTKENQIYCVVSLYSIAHKYLNLIYEFMIFHCNLTNNNCLAMRTIQIDYFWEYFFVSLASLKFN